MLLVLAVGGVLNYDFSLLTLGDDGLNLARSLGRCLQSLDFPLVAAGGNVVTIDLEICFFGRTLACCGFGVVQDK